MSLHATYASQKVLATTNAHALALLNASVQ